MGGEGCHLRHCGHTLHTPVFPLQGWQLRPPMHAIRLYPPALRAVGTAQDTSARAAGGGRLRLAHARLPLGRLPHAACRTSFSTRCAVAGATPATATGSAARDERWSHVSGLARAGDALELEQEHLPLDARGACHRSPTPRLPLPLLALRVCVVPSVAIERGGGHGQACTTRQHRADLPTRPCVSRDPSVTRNRTTSPSHLAFSPNHLAPGVCVCGVCGVSG